MAINKTIEISTKRLRVLRFASSTIDFCLVYAFIFIFYFWGQISLLNSLLFNAMIAFCYFLITALFFHNCTLGLWITRLKVVYINYQWWKQLIYLITLELNFIPYIQLFFVPLNLCFMMVKPTLMLHNILARSYVVYKYSNFAKIGEVWSDKSS